MDLVKYGSVTKTTKFANFDEVWEETTVTERHPVESSKDILEEFLKLHRRYVDEGLHCIALKLIEKDGKPQFVDLTFTK